MPQNANGTSPPAPTRDAKGRLMPGTAPINPGGRPRNTAVYLQCSMRHVSLGDWAKIVEKAKEDAIRGDKDARNWLSKIFGLDKLEVGVTTSMNPEALRLAMLTPRELLAEYQQALDGIAGPAPGSEPSAN